MSQINLNEDFPAEDLITAVKEKPLIWKSRHRDHTNKRLVKMAWDEIKKKFPNQNVEDLKKKWKYFRDQYRKELKKMLTPKSGDAAPEGSSAQLKYFPLLTFLREEVTPNTGDSNLRCPDTVSDGKSVKNNVQSPCSSSSSQPIKSESRKRKSANDIRAEFTQIEKKRLQLIEREMQTTSETTPAKWEVYHFLMSLLPQLEAFTPAQRFRVRNRINMSILEEFNNSDPCCYGYSTYHPDQPGPRHE